jgi:plastocyanin
MSHRLAALATALLAGFILTSCGDDEEAPTTTPVPASPSAASPSTVLVQPEPVQALQPDFTEAAEGVVEVTIQGALFVGNNVRVTFGEAVKIDVTNKDTESHNLRIAGFDGQYQTEDDAITAPDPISGGGSGSLDFAPAVPGQYTFRCDYHPGTMGGRVTVE